MKQVNFEQKKSEEKECSKGEFLAWTVLVTREGWCHIDIEPEKPASITGLQSRFILLDNREDSFVRRLSDGPSLLLCDLASNLRLIPEPLQWGGKGSECWGLNCLLKSYFSSLKIKPSYLAFWKQKPGPLRGIRYRIITTQLLLEE